MRTVIAIDIGGSGVRVGRIGADGSILGPVSRAAFPATADASTILHYIAGGVKVLTPANDVAVGVAVPALLDEHGRVGFCSNLPSLASVDLRCALSPITGDLPLLPLTDAGAAALAEGGVGAGKGVQRALCVTIGTGVNAAMTVSGELLATAGGCLGEAGQVCVEPDGPRCSCGGLGCLEAVASGASLARDGRGIGLHTAKDVVQAGHDGDSAAIALLARSGRALGRAIAIWSVMLLPQRVILAGGLAAARTLLLDPAAVELRRVGPPFIVSEIDLTCGLLGADATLIGAGLFALAHDRRALAATDH